MLATENYFLHETMAEVAADDNFFINEPQNLRNNFFNKDKKIQMVELLNKAHNDSIINKQSPTPPTITNNNNITTRRMSLSQMNGTSCRYSYTKKKIQQLQKLHKHNTSDFIATISNMPASSSLITRLEILCQATYNSDDLSVAKSAVDLLVSAANRGCCFLEKYIVLLVNFCTKHHPTTLDDETMKIKLDELLNRVLSVEFDRQQMTENLKRPEYKLNSVKQIIQLLQRCQHMLDYREQKAVDWLFVVLDAYFVDLATSDEANDVIDQISAHINFQCALLRETEITKAFLKTVVDYCSSTSMDGTKSKSNYDQTLRHKQPPHYYIEQIEF